MKRAVVRKLVVDCATSGELQGVNALPTVEMTPASAKLRGIVTMLPKYQIGAITMDAKTAGIMFGNRLTSDVVADAVG